MGVFLTPEYFHVYMSEREQWSKMEVDPDITKNGTGALTIGNGIYIYYYPKETLIRKLTYWADMIVDNKNTGFKNRFINSNYHTFKWNGRPFDETFGLGS